MDNGMFLGEKTLILPEPLEVDNTPPDFLSVAQFENQMRTDVTTKTESVLQINPSENHNSFIDYMSQNIGNFQHEYNNIIHDEKRLTKKLYRDLGSQERNSLPNTEFLNKGNKSNESSPGEIMINMENLSKVFSRHSMQLVSFNAVNALFVAGKNSLNKLLNM